MNRPDPIVSAKAAVGSIFAARLKQCIGLSDAEAAFLDQMEANERFIARRTILCRAGDPMREAFVLKSGWAISHSQYPDGTRQIRRLHLPGDLLAMPGMAMRHHPANIETLTPAVVSPFDRRAFAHLFVEHPRLTAIMFIFAQEERVTSGDRMGCIGRLSCKERIAFLLLDLFHRLKGIAAVDGATFEMHLTREQMAEITGMTPIHASRMWSELISEGAIAADGHRVTILDKEWLRALSGYVNRSDDLDFSWIPDRDSSAFSDAVFHLAGPATRPTSNPAS